MLLSIVIAFLSLPVSVSSAYRLSQQDGLRRPWGVNSEAQSTKPRNKDGAVIGTENFEEIVSTTTSIDLSIEPDIRLTDAPQTKGDSADPPKIIIMGGPASGKGTQCERIASQYGVVHLSTGDMLREAVRQDSEGGVGAIAKSYMDAGQLVPDEIMIQIVMDRISQADCQQQGWLLDGFPRTPAQAESLSKMGIAADCFIFLNVPDSELIERVVGRRLDPVTGKIYHMKFFPPPEDIHARLTQRNDDTVEKMTQRLQQFHDNVGAVRSYYEDVLVEIDGTGDLDSITERIVSGISSMSRRHRAAK